MNLNTKTIVNIAVSIVLLASIVLGAFVLHNTEVKAAAGQVLILDSTVTGGASSKEALAAIAVGKTPIVVSAATWGSMTAAQFASYDGIILGDKTCSTNVADVAAAAANTNVWGPAINGNIIIIGTDPVYHFGSQIGAQKLVNQGMAFALSEAGKTGGYLDLSCYYHFSGSGTPVPFLNGINGGGFTVIGASNLPGLNNVHITATHPALTGLTDADLSNWYNSVHEGFEQWPIGLEVLAIARDAVGSYTAPDGTRGYPYILARGVQIISDIKLAPDTATNPVGTSHTLTATVTTDDPAPGTPVVGTTVTFTVIAGPHTGTTGTGVTDNNGQATFSYTGTTAGVDTIEATFVDSRGITQRSNRVTKEWVDAPIVDVIKLAPDTATNPVGTSHTLTATVTTNGAPVIGTTVTFTVIAGPHVGTMGTGITDNNGQATFSYTGTTAGVDTIEATFVNSGGITQHSNKVTKQWVEAPVVKGIKMTGGGQVYTNEKNHSHSFGFNMTPVVGGVNVNLEYNDNHTGKASGKKGAPSPLQIHIKADAEVLSVINDASGKPIGQEVKAACEVRDLLDNNTRTNEACRVIVIDNGEPGKDKDEFLLEVVSGSHAGYTSNIVGSLKLEKGNIQAHK